MDGDFQFSPPIFRPESFFLGRTDGWAEIRPLFGGAVRRGLVTTEGHLDDTYSALHVQETFDWGGGAAPDVWRWVMVRGLDGRYVASEARAGAGIVGRHDGADYLLNFRRPLRETGPQFRAGFATRFSMTDPNTASKRVRLTLYGLPVATMVAQHNRQEQA